jgi:hypothetical protein
LSANLSKKELEERREESDLVEVEETFMVGMPV